MQQGIKASDSFLEQPWEFVTLSPVYRRENKGLKRSNYLLKILWLISDRAGTLTLPLNSKTSYQTLLRSTCNAHILLLLDLSSAIVDKKYGMKMGKETVSSDIILKSY